MNNPVYTAREENVREPNAGGAEPMLLTVTEAAKLLRISRNLCYELIAQKQLPHIRLGRRILLPRYGLEQWISRQAGLQDTLGDVLSFRPQRH